jgi:hypothetical protein
MNNGKYEFSDSIKKEFRSSYADIVFTFLEMIFWAIVLYEIVSNV